MAKSGIRGITLKSQVNFGTYHVHQKLVGILGPMMSIKNLYSNGKIWYSVILTYPLTQIWLNLAKQRGEATNTKM